MRDLSGIESSRPCVYCLAYLTATRPTATRKISTYGVTAFIRNADTGPTPFPAHISGTNAADTMLIRLVSFLMNELNPSGPAMRKFARLAAIA